MLRALLERLPREPDGLRTVEVVFGSVLVAAVSGGILFTDPKLVLGGIVAIILALVFFSRPAYSLIGVFVIRVIIDLFWWAPVDVGGLNVLEAFGGGVAAMGAVLFYLELRRVEKNRGFVALVVYFVILIVASVRSGDVRDAAEILAKYVSPLLLMFLVSSLMDSSELRRKFLIFVTLACLVSLAVSVYHLATGQMAEHFRQGYFRLVGGYKNLHNHALFLLVCNALIFFWMMRAQDRWRQALLLGLQALALACLYFTYVRTALTGLAVFVGVFLVLEKKWNLLLVAGLGAVAVLVTNADLQDRFSDVVAIFGEGDALGSKRTLGSGRFGIWTMSFGEFTRQGLTDQLLGLGLGGHYEMTDPYQDMYRSLEKSENLDPHNDYLSLLYQLGPVAVICYVGLQAQVIYRGIQLRRVARSPFARAFGSMLIALTVVTFITNFLSNAFIQRVTVAWLFWGLAGIGAALLRAEEQHQDKTRRPEVVPLSKGSNPRPGVLA